MQKADLFLRMSRNNDGFARCIRGRSRSTDETKTIIKKWRSCQHLFVEVRKAEYTVGFHSSDYEIIPARYECVRCGLTNRLIDTEKVLDRLIAHHKLKKVADETAEWENQQPKISDENLLSTESIQTFHPGILFDIATELCLAQKIKPTKENVFDIMKELCEMETIPEQLKISTPVHASALIERYKKKHKLYIDENT